MSKTDNRVDYEAHLQEHIDHTASNLKEADDYLDEHKGEITAGKNHVIEAKNDRRKESIEGFIASRLTTHNLTSTKNKQPLPILEEAALI